MTIRIFYYTISMYYKPFAGLAPWALKSTPLPNLIFPIHSFECGIFCRLHQDLPRSGFNPPPANCAIPIGLRRDAYLNLFRSDM